MPRTIAICGNLGYDTEPPELESRCYTLLKELGFGDEQMSIAAKYRGKGSSCEVIFTSADLLALARIKVKAARKEYVEGRSVWLDVAKTREENAPNRMFHRVHDYLQNMHASKGIEKNATFKSIKVDGSIVGYPRGSTWQWTEKARDIFSTEELEMAAAYASQQ